MGAARTHACVRLSTECALLGRRRCCCVARTASASQPVVVCTTRPDVARHCNLMSGTVPMLLPSKKVTMGQIRDKVRAPASRAKRPPLRCVAPFARGVGKLGTGAA